ncbi:hypothetical protein T440DRAFT_219956 [Plenodomus tracheiphilus IPT5]|uniref:Uncharacterized protein n=1 Tax=Plenodomus tracheiphilus IPT5 TaxID=1408161 RepID=A0A6A7AUT1_9PLEO|nr:hypothetical protein T440DRAFT_219956 [Plenodomus tracheiphilus IPT5]
MGFIWEFGKFVFRTLKAIMKLTKDFFWLFSGLAMLNAFIDMIKIYAMDFVWVPWGLMMRRRVMDHLIGRLMKNARISRILAKGTSISGKLKPYLDISLWSLVLLIMGSQRLVKWVRSNPKHAPGAASPPSSPESVQPFGTTDDDSSGASDMPSLESVFSDSDGQLLTRQQFMQRYANRRHMDLFYADGLMDDELDSDSGSEILVAPPTSPV